jgi:hypothetical protein
MLKSDFILLRNCGALLIQTQSNTELEIPLLLVCEFRAVNLLKLISFLDELQQAPHSPLQQRLWFEIKANFSRAPMQE